MPWAIEWRSENRLDGRTERLVGRFGMHTPACPDHLSGYRTMVFKTRQQARDFINVHYAYIRKRPDLQVEPHGWKMPRPIKVEVTVNKI